MESATPVDQLSALQGEVLTSRGSEDPDRTWTYAEIANRVRDLRAIFQRMAISIHPQSALGALLEEAKVLAEDWTVGRNGNDIQQVIRAAHAIRVVEAVESAIDDDGVIECLRRIAKNDMNLSGRTVSQGKDALWELDLLASFKRHSVQARLCEPPDIVADFGLGPYGVACKKVYSENNVEKQLRSGCKQLSSFGGRGLVALNIDDLVPQDNLLEGTTHTSAGDFLAQKNIDFINRNLAKFGRFVAQGRCDGILVSTTLPAAIARSRVGLSNFTETVVWTFAGIKADAAQRILAVKEALT